jgi:hypothetical protein
MKGLHISPHSETANFSASNNWIDGFMKDNAAYREYQKRAIVLIQTLQKTEKITNSCKKLKVVTSSIKNAHQMGYLSVYNLPNPSILKNTLSWWDKV